MPRFILYTSDFDHKRDAIQQENPGRAMAVIGRDGNDVQFPGNINNARRLVIFSHGRYTNIRGQNLVFASNGHDVDVDISNTSLANFINGAMRNAPSSVLILACNSARGADRQNSMGARLRAAVNNNIILYGMTTTVASAQAPYIIKSFLNRAGGVVWHCTTPGHQGGPI